MKEVGDPRFHTVPEMPWKRTTLVRRLRWTGEKDNRQVYARTYRARVIWPRELKYERVRSIIDSHASPSKKA